MIETVLVICHGFHVWKTWLVQSDRNRLGQRMTKAFSKANQTIATVQTMVRVPENNPNLMQNVTARYLHQ
jgi:hypothetical protein